MASGDVDIGVGGTGGVSSGMGVIHFNCSAIASRPDCGGGEGLEEGGELMTGELHFEYHGTGWHLDFGARSGVGAGAGGVGGRVRPCPPRSGVEGLILPISFASSSCKPRNCTKQTSSYGGVDTMRSLSSHSPKASSDKLLMDKALWISFPVGSKSVGDPSRCDP